MMRRRDPVGADFSRARRPRDVKQQAFADPGHLVLPRTPTTIGAVTGSSVVVTLFDRRRGSGGLCHFALPEAPEGVETTPIYGLSSTKALIRAMLAEGSLHSDLVAGIFGGACPENRGRDAHALARANVAAGANMLKNFKISRVDDFTGGVFGLKLWYVTSSNEMAIVKTDAIRESDWFPYGTSDWGKR